MDGAPACPFVAFGDDRDGRRRARPPPSLLRRIATGAARARAPGGVLPVERVPGLPDVPGLGAARGRRTRAGRRAPEPAPTAVAAAAPLDRHAGRTTAADERRGRPVADEPRLRRAAGRRNPPRDWAAPPPWATALAQPRGPGGRAGSELLAGRRRGPGSRGQRRRPARRRSRPGGGRFGGGRLVGLGGRAHGDPARTTTWPGLVRRSAGPAPPIPGRRAVPRPPSTARPPAGRQLDPADGRRDRRSVVGADAPLRGLSDDQDARRLPGMPGLPRVAVLAGALGDRRTRAVHAAGAPRHRRRRRLRTRARAPAAPVATASAVADRRRRADAAGLRDQGRATRCRRSPSVRADARGAAGRQHRDIKDPNKIAIGDEIIIPLRRARRRPAPSGAAAP